MNWLKVLKKPIAISKINYRNKGNKKKESQLSLKRKIVADKMHSKRIRVKLTSEMEMLRVDADLLVVKTEKLHDSRCLTQSEQQKLPHEKQK